jgi:hypothetical protein
MSLKQDPLVKSLKGILNFEANLIPLNDFIQNERYKKYADDPEQYDAMVKRCLGTAVTARMEELKKLKVNK